MDKIAILYESYGDLLSKVGKDIVEMRIMALASACEKFLVSTNNTQSVKLNIYILAHSVLDCFTDLSRLKDFHHIVEANSFKVKSYQISWFLRRKPLQISDNDNESLVYINEKFALTYVVAFFEELIGHNFYENLSDLNKRNFDGYLDTLYYYFKFRNCNPQALELALLGFGAGLAASNITHNSDNINS